MLAIINIKKERGKLMVRYKLDELQDKVVGGVQETAGKLTNDKRMEYKGKARQGVGKARHTSREIKNEIGTITNRTVGTVKEKTGDLTDDKFLQLKGKMQRLEAENKISRKLLYGAGIVASVLIIRKLLSSNEED